MNEVGQRFAQDHRELEALLKRLSEDALAPESAALQATWYQLEPRLLAHLATEEQYLVPLIEASYPAEAARISAEHSSLRGMIAELGVAIDLHTVRHNAIEQLIEMMREHALHEGQTLYPLAGDRASTVVQRRVSAKLKAGRAGH